MKISQHNVPLVENNKVLIDLEPMPNRNLEDNEGKDITSNKPIPKIIGEDKGGMEMASIIEVDGNHISMESTMVEINASYNPNSRDDILLEGLNQLSQDTNKGISHLMVSRFLENVLATSSKHLSHLEALFDSYKDSNENP